MKLLNLRIEVGFQAPHLYYLNTLSLQKLEVKSERLDTGPIFLGRMQPGPMEPWGWQMSYKEKLYIPFDKSVSGRSALGAKHLQKYCF